MSGNIGGVRLACHPPIPYVKEVRSLTMSAVFSKITSKSQTTVPKKVREALRVKPGDTLVYRIVRGKVTLAKAEPLDRAYLKSLESTLSEWESPEDAAAYDDL
jgi:antitoxin PrlF